MAYQTNRRDPLIDSAMQAAIEKRGRELVGLAVLGLGLCVAALLASYVPDDPSFFSATDEPAQNWLGRAGASIAAPLFIIFGVAAWTIAVILVGWGLRLTANAGAERVLTRAIFLPLAVFAASVYASTLVPAPDWTHSFGLGGLLGDTALGALINLLPVRASEGVRLLALPIGAAAIATCLYAAGCTAEELKRFGRFVAYGIVLIYAGIVSSLGSGARRTRDAAREMGERRALQRAARAEEIEEEETTTDMRAGLAPEPPVTRAAPATPRGKAGGLLASVTKAVRRAPDPAEDLAQDDAEDGLEGEDRVRARISSAIRARALTGQDVRPAPVGRSEPPVRRPRKPEPLIVKVPGAVPVAPMAEIDVEPPVPVHPRQPEPIEDTPDDPAPQGRIAPRVQPEARPPVPEVEPRAVVQHPPRKAPAPSRRAQAEAQPSLAFDAEDGTGFEIPPLSLLTSPDRIVRHVLPDEALEENARMLENVLDDYGVKGEIVSVRPGPVVTMYELEPAPGLKASRVIGLADDIARSMSALSARVSTVPGRSVIGIELPNVHREKVLLRELLSTRDYDDASMRLPLALGKDIGGSPVVANLAKMPHLLIAGTTGSGKSVAINTMILSLLYRLTPEECRLIMIDPKMLELSVYDGIPHLLSPVVTDPKKAVVALKWVVGEMEER
ncbi:MAG: DNA translocase FtsK 4TM domain-containing protein, partial [Pseudomonadota bacterium]